MKEQAEEQREPYCKPELTRLDNLKDVTFEDCTWQCSFSW
jgi:hypothetical protein